MWVLYALSTAVLTSFNPILYKHLLRNATPLVLVWGVTSAALPLLGLFALAFTPQLPAVDAVFILTVLGSALLNVVAHLASTTALQRADVSLVTPMLNFSPLFTLLLATSALGEVPSPRGILGVGLVLVGAYWITRSSEASWFAPFRALSVTPSVLLVLLAGLLWAITPLLEKIAIQHTFPQSPLFTAFVATALLVLLLTPIVWVRHPSALKKLNRQRTLWLLASAIAGGAPILGYTAMSLGYVGYVTTLFKLSSVLTVLWATWILHEHGLAQRLPACSVMVGGALLITI